MGRNSLNNDENNVSKEIIKLKKKKIIRKRRRIKRITSILVISLIVGLIAVGVYMYSFFSGLSNNNLQGAIDPIGKDTVNILVLGLDIGDAEQAENEVGRRTDTMMVLNYNPITKKAQIVSIPRDIYIEIEDTSNAVGDNYWKMNAAYAIDGAKEVTKQVEELLEIKINYLFEIDYNSFSDIVDAIGGVEIYIDQDMYYDDDIQNLHINFNAGETVHLDGKKAEEFFRWRGNNDGTGSERGDLGRIENQQKFIKAVIKKAMSPSIVPKIPKILNTISKNIDTNMQVSQMIKYSKELVSINLEDIKMSTLQGVDKYIGDEAFLIFDREMNLDIINSLKSGEVTGNIESESESESETNIGTDSGIKKEDLKIIVLNATKINGLAGGLQTELYNLGYGVVEIGNLEPQDKSTIMVENKEIKELLKTDTGIKKSGKISDSEYKEYDAVIVLGKDYDLFGE